MVWAKPGRICSLNVIPYMLFSLWFFFFGGVGEEGNKQKKILYSPFPPIPREAKYETKASLQGLQNPGVLWKEMCVFFPLHIKDHKHRSGSLGALLQLKLRCLQAMPRAVPTLWGWISGVATLHGALCKANTNISMGRKTVEWHGYPRNYE